MNPKLPLPPKCWLPRPSRRWRGCPGQECEPFHQLCYGQQAAGMQARRNTISKLSDNSNAAVAAAAHTLRSEDQAVLRTLQRDDQTNNGDADYRQIL